MARGGPGDAGAWPLHAERYLWAYPASMLEFRYDSE